MSRPLSYPREKIRVLLLEGIHTSAEEALGQSGYTLVDRARRLPADLGDVRLLGIRSQTRIDRDLLERAPRLLAIGCFCIGTNQVDLAAAAERGVPVFNAPHANTRSVAELVIGLTVMLLRGTFTKALRVREGSWPKTAAGSHEVRGKTMGIIGYGHIGSQVSILAEALGMRVIYFDIVPKLPLGNALAADSLEELLGSADVVSLHVPLTDQTSGLLDAARIADMRSGSFLINTSRGAVVVPEAVARAIESKQLAGAALDVFPAEPHAAEQALESPLRGMDNVILTPHVAGSTLEAQEKIGHDVAQKLTGYSDRGSTVGAVNFPEINLAANPRAHRILHIHRNVPGILRQINAAVAEENINVLAQHLETSNGIGYVVLDIEKTASTRLFQRLKQVAGTVRARILY